MDHAVHSLIATISAHPQYAYATLFLAALLEAVPVAGSLVPGSTLILSLSALIATGDLSLGAVLGSAIAGAALGDGAAFWIGHRDPGRIRQFWPLNSHPELIRRSETFFHRYGIVAVFLARFVPPVRAFVPITAGALGMPPRTFYAFNIAAILFWAPAHVLPGMLAGSAYEHAGVIAEHLLLPIVVGVAGVAAIVWIVRRRMQH